MKLSRIICAALMSATVTTAAHAADPNVRCVQAHLENSGLDAGGAEGLYGRKTQAAADKYQTYAAEVSGLPPLSRDNAKQWCDAVRPPLSLRDGYWVARFGGGCAMLRISHGTVTYQSGSCRVDGGISQVQYMAPNGRVGSDVVVSERQIKIEAAECNDGYMVTPSRLRCDWSLNGYEEAGVSFDWQEKLAGF